MLDVEGLRAQAVAELDRDAGRHLHHPEVEPREDHAHPLLALLRAVKRDAAQLGERVQAEHVVVVVVGEEHLVGHGLGGEELLVGVRAGVDQHPAVEQERGTQTAVTRVGRGALRAVAAEPGDGPGSRGAQHRHSHSASHFGWCRRAQSRRTVPTVIPRREWRVLAFSVAR